MGSTAGGGVHGLREGADGSDAVTGNDQAIFLTQQGLDVVVDWARWISYLGRSGRNCGVGGLTLESTSEDGKNEPEDHHEGDDSQHGNKVLLEERLVLMSAGSRMTLPGTGVTLTIGRLVMRHVAGDVVVGRFHIGQPTRRCD